MTFYRNGLKICKHANKSGVKNLEPINSIGFRLRELDLLVGRFMEAQGKVDSLDNVKGPQAWALGYLVDNREKEIYQRDLEQQMSIRRSTASKLVERLQKNGYIETVPSAKDKRLKQIIVTDKAIEDIHQIDAIVEQAEAKLRKNISDAELNQFFTTIDKLRNNIEKDID